MITDQRINKAYSQIKQEGIDSLLVALPANITYLTGQVSRDSWLLLAKGKSYYLTDSRYTSEAKKQLNRGFLVIEAEGSLIEALAEISKKLCLKKLGVEYRHISAFAYQRLNASLDQITELVPKQNIIEPLREIKNKEELAKIKKATEIAANALKFIKNRLSAGMREIEVAGEIERFIRYKGAEAASFETIVASGPNSSYPHHRTSSRKLAKNEPVLIDMGVDYCGYKSDLTRVFFLGKINPLVRKVYRIVAEAQNRAFKCIKPGTKTDKVDMAARQYIADKGYGGLFNHSLGHGVGLEIHESPRLSPRESRSLKKGMVFTVEPAVYLPGKFGIRIEDTVAVTQKGVEVLSGTLNK